jgi:N6-L-threonylcarbamoyladenine synthase
VTETLAIKCERALRETGMKALVVAGGVGANRQLRSRLAALAAKRKVAVSFPRLEFCTDNGAMIAYAGCQRLLQGEREPLAVAIRARWPMTELEPPGAPAEGGQTG